MYVNAKTNCKIDRLFHFFLYYVDTFLSSKTINIKKNNFEYFYVCLLTYLSLQNKYWLEFFDIS